MLDKLSDNIGVPEDQIRLILLILAGYPLGLINYLLKNPKVRLVYGLVSGFLLQYFMYGWPLVHIIISTTLTYLFMLFFGRKLSAFWILGITVAHLSALHIKRMVEDFGGWQLDVTTIYMMSICKFSGIAFSYEDGDKKDEDLKSSYHRSKKIVEMPTLLETFSYIFYFPSSVVGPSFEFADFRQFIHLSGPYSDLPVQLAIKSAFSELLKALVNIASVLFLLKPFDFKYCVTDEYAEKPYWYKFVYFNISMLIQRTKYYGGWKIAQSGIVLCGLGYNPTTKVGSNGEKIIEHKFDKVENAVIREVELDPNPKRRIQYWNRTVHLWLKYNLFLRLLNIENKTFKNNKGLASLLTFMVSAFWHGFYPVYYYFFFLFYILEQVCTFLEEDLNFFNYLNKQNYIVQQIVSLFTMSFCNYLGIVFCLLTLKNAYVFSYNLLFIFPVFLVFSFIILNKNHSKKKRAEYKEKKERELVKTSTPSGDEKKLS